MEAFYLEIKEHLKKQLEANWSETSKFMRECAERLLGVTSGKVMVERENWWWNGEVQEAIKWKKDERREKYRLGTEESKKEYIQANKLAKKAVAKAKWIAYRDVYKSLEEQGGVNTAIRVAKCRKRKSEDVSHIRCIKNNGGGVLLDGDSKNDGRSTLENDRIQRDVQQRAVRDVRDISKEEVRDGMRKMKK